MPAGIGDCHWVLMRMRAFRAWLEHQHNDKIHLVAHIAHDEHHKSTEYVSLTRFFDEVVEDEHGMRGVVDHLNPIYATIAGSLGKDSRSGGRHLDYAFQANGHLEAGRRIEDWLPELNAFGGLDYTYPLDVRGDGSLDDVEFTPRILLYPSGTGPNVYFKSGWQAEHWQALLETLNFHGHKPTFVGAGTRDDMGYFGSLHLEGDFENLVGKTSLREYMALIMSCRVWFGLNSGGGIVSAAMRRNTIMLWSDGDYGGRLAHAMQRNWVGDAPNYHPFSYGSGSEQKMVDKLVEVCNATR